MKYVSDPATLKHFEEQYAACTIRYGDLKKQLAEDIIAVIAPIRERIHDIYNDSAYLARVTKQGAERARESADQTIAEVRRIMGIRRFW
jgi:tryptophanyl-tRNA synthetase